MSESIVTLGIGASPVSLTPFITSGLFVGATETESVAILTRTGSTAVISRDGNTAVTSRDNSTSIKV